MICNIVKYIQNDLYEREISKKRKNTLEKLSILKECLKENQLENLDEFLYNYDILVDLYIELAFVLGYNFALRGDKSVDFREVIKTIKSARKDD